MSEKLCECGCGQPVIFYKYKIRRFLKGHQARGNNNSNWQGGFSNTKNWYKKIWMPEHPYAHNNYVYVHRLVMEKHLRRYLKPYEEVHHIDHDIHNNDISNLFLTNKKEHPRQHMMDMSDRKCLLCNSINTYINKKGRPVWFIYENGVICTKCKRIIMKKQLQKKVVH